jgi:hypothetical protein
MRDATRFGAGKFTQQWLGVDALEDAPLHANKFVVVLGDDAVALD